MNDFNALYKPRIFIKIWQISLNFIGKLNQKLWESISYCHNTGVFNKVVFEYADSSGIVDLNFVEQ